MAKYSILEEKTNEVLSRRLEELSRSQPVSLQGFAYNTATKQYACLLCFPSEQAVEVSSPLTPEEVKSIERNNALALWEQSASKRDISDYLGISEAEVESKLKPLKNSGKGRRGGKA